MRFYSFFARFWGITVYFGAVAFIFFGGFLVYSLANNNKCI